MKNKNNKNYKLIWLDDEEANIEALKTQIEQFIVYCGYTPVVKDFRTYDEEFMKIVKEPTVNLIITDLNLLDGKNGMEVIETIRENSIWHDILLYSSDAKGLHQVLKGLDGIYYHAFTDFDSLRKKIEAVITANIVRDEYALIREKNYLS